MLVPPLARRRFVVAMAAFALFECLTLVAQVRYVRPAAFVRHAPTIAVRGPVRVGYLCGDHDCSGVWTYDWTGTLGPDVRVLPAARAWDAATRRRVVNELRGLPVQLAIETVWASVLATWFFVVVPRAFARVSPPDRPRAARPGGAAVAVGVLAGVGGWALVIAPAVLGYAQLPNAPAHVPIHLLPGALFYRMWVLLAAAPAVPALAVLEACGAALIETHLFTTGAALGFAVYAVIGAVAGRPRGPERASQRHATTDP